MSSVHRSGAVDTEAVRAALETSDAQAIIDLFADDAELLVLDHLHPPSRPQVLRGKAAIAAYWHDVCGRRMTHTVERIVHDGTTLAYSEACRYPDGTRVQCLAFLDLVNGKIARQMGVQAWDE
jgi:ketosteroid isomerase-like protein